MESQTPGTRAAKDELKGHNNILQHTAHSNLQSLGEGASWRTIYPSWCTCG